MIAWEFTVTPADRDAFVRTYGPDGDWAALFARARGFLGLTLLADLRTEGHFVTLDRWEDETAFRAFRADPALAAEYEALDLVCTAWTTHEALLGTFMEVES